MRHTDYLIEHDLLLIDKVHKTKNMKYKSRKKEIISNTDVNYIS